MAEDLKIRRAHASDISQIMALAGHAEGAAHWAEGQYEEIFAETTPFRLLLVIEDHSGLLGFLAARQVDTEWELENIAVAVRAQRRGLGAKLLDEFLGIARKRGGRAIFLEVRESNHAARGLYRKLAFVESGRRPSYYGEPPEDAITYCHSLANSTDS